MSKLLPPWRRFKGNLSRNLWSGQIIIFHQPRFPWNKGMSLTITTIWGKSIVFSVAIIWPVWWYFLTECESARWKLWLHRSAICVTLPTTRQHFEVPKGRWRLITLERSELHLNKNNKFKGVVSGIRYYQRFAKLHKQHSEPMFLDEGSKPADVWSTNCCLTAVDEFFGTGMKIIVCTGTISWFLHGS